MEEKATSHCFYTAITVRVPQMYLQHILSIEGLRFEAYLRAKKQPYTALYMHHSAYTHFRTVLEKTTFFSSYRRSLHILRSTHYMQLQCASYCHSMPVNEGREWCYALPTIKMKARSVVGSGGTSLFSDPGSESPL